MIATFGSVFMPRPQPPRGASLRPGLHLILRPGWKKNSGDCSPGVYDWRNFCIYLPVPEPLAFGTVPGVLGVGLVPGVGGVMSGVPGADGTPGVEGLPIPVPVPVPEPVPVPVPVPVDVSLPGAPRLVASTPKCE